MSDRANMLFMLEDLTWEHGVWWPKAGTHRSEKYVKAVEHMSEALSLCNQTRTVIQAGGHVGCFPKWLASRFKHVYTFEPDFMNFRALTMNVIAKNVYPFRAVLGDEHFPVDLKVVENIGGHRVQMDSDEPGHRMPVLGPIPQICIDDLNLQDVDYIMLDVEGYEYPALLGAIKTIKRCFPVIQVEDRGHGYKKGRGDTFDQLVDYLGTMGYAPLMKVQRDVVFATQAHVR